jgi:hypothetical protein
VSAQIRRQKFHALSLHIRGVENLPFSEPTSATRNASRRCSHLATSARRSTSHQTVSGTGNRSAMPIHSLRALQWTETYCGLLQPTSTTIAAEFDSAKRSELIGFAEADFEK